MRVTPAGIVPDVATNSGGATLTAVDPVAGKYELSIPSLGINYAFQTPPSAPAGSYVLTPPNGDVVRLITGGLRSVELGAWSVRSGSTGELKGFAFYTTGHAVKDMPTTGTATYSFGSIMGVVVVPTSNGYSSVELYGLGPTLTADFATGAVSGSLQIRTWDGTASTPWNDVSISASIAAGTSSFSGTTAAASAPDTPFALDASAAGHVDGRFYGVGAKSVGGVWSLSDGVRSAIGAFSGSTEAPSGGGVGSEAGIGEVLGSGVP